VINDIYVNISLNGKVVEKVHSINDNIELLGIGQFVCATNILPSKIVSGLKVDGINVNLEVNDVDFNEYTSIFDENSRSTPLNVKEISIKADVLLKARTIFENSSQIFRETAGVHGAGLYDENGDEIIFIKDIARHNNIIKLIGYMTKERFDKKAFILTSSRINKDIVRLAKISGIKLIATRGAPSYLAIKEAKKNEISLVGFLKENRFTLFFDKNRIL